MNLRNKKYCFLAAAFLASALALWFLWDTYYRDVPREATYTKETAIDLMPPLEMMILNESIPLLSNFSAALGAEVERFSPKAMDLPFIHNKLVFKEGELQINFELRQFFDKFLLLHPEVGLQGVRYLLAKDVEKNAADDASARLRFKQVDRVFCSYVNLLRALESLPANPSDNNMFETHLNQIMALRRQYLGETIARIFFSKEEEKLLKKIK